MDIAILRAILWILIGVIPPYYIGKYLFRKIHLLKKYKYLIHLLMIICFLFIIYEFGKPIPSQIIVYILSALTAIIYGIYESFS